jgi:hypothetical protein
MILGVLCASVVNHVIKVLAPGGAPVTDFVELVAF